MIGQEDYETKNILESYMTALDEASLTNTGNGIIDKTSITNMDSHVRNQLIKDTFYKGYNNAKNILNTGTDNEKSELERIIANVFCIMGQENLKVSAYGTLKNIEYNELKKNFYNAFFCGAYTAMKKPNLSEKEKHEELIKLTV